MKSEPRRLRRFSVIVILFLLALAFSIVERGISVGTLFLLIIAAVLLFTTSALLQCDDITASQNDHKFWRTLLKWQGILFVVLCIVIPVTDWVVDSIWLLPSTTIAFRHIWRDVEISLHLALPFSAMILGTLTGRRYRLSEKPVQSPNIVVERDEEKPGAPTHKWPPYHYFWTQVAVISTLPLLISLSLVVVSVFYRHNGLFYSPLDRTHVGRVQWEANDVLSFLLVGHHISDCVGCSPIRYCNYEVNLQSGVTREVECGEIDVETYFSPHSGMITTRPSARNPLPSPDGKRLAYVVKGYDVYVRPAEGGRLSRQRVYRYPSSGFFGRYYRELAMALLYSLPVGVALSAPWAYTSRRQPHVRRLFFFIAVLNIAFFVGSLMDAPSAISLHSYLWATIP